jgi:predicted alpha-1,2-mannosidase
MPRWLLVAAAVAFTSCVGPPGEGAVPAVPPYASSFARLVDPLIGTAGEGNTFPGAVAPWGMVSVSPHTIYSTPQSFFAGQPLVGSGYRHGEPYLYGFGLTQLSGTGCPDLGAPVITATVGDVRPYFEEYRATYRDEVAWPGYYAVELAGGVRVEATAAPRAGVLRFRFPARDGDANILVDVGHNLGWAPPDGSVRVVSPTEIEGSSSSGLFCARPNLQTTYFVARVSRAATASGTWRDRQLASQPQQTGGAAGAYLRFRTSAGEAIVVAVGVSYVSIDGARRNLQAEIDGELQGQLERVRAATFAAWERTLARVRVAGGTPPQRTIFYTALYHMLIHPSLLSDVDGLYPTMARTAGGRAAAPGYERYSVFSLWDTYRNVHPFLTLVYPERQAPMLRSLAEMARESGQVPMWELIGSEVNMMVGDPLLPMVADSALKGLSDYDLRGLYARMREAALRVEAPLHRPGNASYLALGYVPMDEAAKVWGPVSTTLEYAFADWALAQLAGSLGEQADAERFAAQSRRAAGALFDPQTRLLRPRFADGRFLTPFDPDALEGARGQPRAGGPGYVEGNAWSYSYFVPHDVAGLVALHGGAAPFVADLQRLFDEDKFVLWNEPDMAYPYLFAHLEGESWRTAREVSRARSRFFGAGPDGLPGNDDAGTLSAWYVFSAIGLYPDCPASLRYSMGTPLFDRVELSLPRPGGAMTTFVVEADRRAPDEIYVERAALDGATLTAPFLTHRQIVAGGTLRLTMAASR